MALGPKADAPLRYMSEVCNHCSQSYLLLVSGVKKPAMTKTNIKTRKRPKPYFSYFLLNHKK